MKAVGPVREPDWAKLSKEWEISGLRQRDFCELAGVSYTAFMHKRGLLRKAERQAARLFPVLTDRKQASDFIPVSVEPEESERTVPQTATSSSSPDLVVELPFGVVLRFRGVGQR